MQAELRELIAQKDAMEKEIGSLTTQIELLDETKQFGQGLVDREGFPRSDLDFGEIANYRNLKRRKAELNNDHFALMKIIETKLYAHFSASQPADPQWNAETTLPQNAFAKPQKTPKTEEKPEKTEHKIDYLTPFARIGSAEEESPAWRGGVREGDLLSEFAEVNIYSLDWRKQLAGCVHEGVPLRLVVMRRAQEGAEAPRFQLKDGLTYCKLVLQVVPARWSGRSLLGCQINPL